MSAFVNLTLFMCSFFLVPHIRYVSPVYPYSLHLQGILYTTLAFFSPRGVFALATQFVTLLSALLVVLNLCFAAILLNLRVNSGMLGIIIRPLFPSSSPIFSLISLGFNEFFTYFLSERRLPCFLIHFINTVKIRDMALGLSGFVSFWGGASAGKIIHG